MFELVEKNQDSCIYFKNMHKKGKYTEENVCGKGSEIV